MVLYLFKQQNEKILFLWSIAIKFIVLPIKPNNYIFFIYFKSYFKIKFKIYFWNYSKKHNLKHFIFNIYYFQAIFIREIIL